MSNNPAIKFIKKYSYSALILTISIFAYLYIAHKNIAFIVDEQAHMWQISEFYRGSSNILYFLTVIPGFHVLGALFQKVLEFINLIPFISIDTFVDSINAKRLFATLIGLISVLTFGTLSKTIHHKSEPIKYLQYFLIPIIFPYLFIVYTDITALLLILLGILCYYKRQFFILTIVALLSLLVRQTNIIWIAFIGCLMFFEYGDSLKENLKQLYKKKPFLMLMRKAYTMIIPAIAFIAFFIVNGGIALGDKDQHPAFSFHSGNLYLFLFLVALVNAPIFLSNTKALLKKTKQIVMKNRLNLIASITAIPFFYWIYELTFKVTHLYNQADKYDWIIRNLFLDMVITTPWMKAAFFVIIFWAALNLWHLEMRRKKEKYLIYLFTILSLIPFWLIEVRYSIVGIVLIALFRKQKSANIEWTQILYNTVLCGIVFYYMTNTIYFL